MKRIYKIMLSIMTCLVLTANMTAQNLDKMPKEKRDSLLIAIAKDVILKYGPGYYREYKKPAIERKQNPINSEGKDAGKFYYTVTYFYDELEEQMEMDYIASVSIKEHTGTPAFVMFGNGLGKIITESKLRGEEEIEPVIYQTRPIAPIYEKKDGFFVENSKPVNTAELKAKGYVEQANGIWVKTRPDVPPVEAMRVLRREGFEERSGRMVRVRPAETTVKKK